MYLHVIVTDNGLNIVKAVNDSCFEGKTCFIHTLQRAIHGGLDAQERINEAIAAGRRIVTHFNHSQPSQEKLQLIQTELNVPKHKIIQDVSTRCKAPYIWLKGYWSKRERFRCTSLTTVTQ
ncbi:unnamed protein product [Parnassius mnemosyne]|uniref:Transposase n=1 Tax=Parnassius mnemosyne TaxID=213953 RepID=A0AAV1LA95_9NEOP